MHIDCVFNIFLFYKFQASESTEIEMDSDTSCVVPSSSSTSSVPDPKPIPVTGKRLCSTSHENLEGSKKTKHGFVHVSII